MSKLDQYAALWTDSLLKSIYSPKKVAPTTQVSPVTQDVTPITQVNHINHINSIEITSTTPARTHTPEDLRTGSLLKSMNAPKKVAPVTPEVAQQEVIDVIKGVTIIREITQVTQEVAPVTQVAPITPEVTQQEVIDVIKGVTIIRAITQVTQNVKPFTQVATTTLSTPARITYTALDLKSHRPNAAPFQKDAISNEIAPFVLPKPKLVSPNVANGNSTLLYRPGVGFEPGVSADGYVDPEVLENEKYNLIVEGITKSCQAVTQMMDLIDAKKAELAQLEEDVMARAKEAFHYEAEFHAHNRQAAERWAAKKAEEERLAAEEKEEEDILAGEKKFEEDRLAAQKKKQDGINAWRTLAGQPSIRLGDELAVKNPSGGIKMVEGVKMVYVGSGVYLEAHDPDFAWKWHNVPYDPEENRSVWDPKHPKNLAAAKGLTYVPKRKYFIGQNRDGTMANEKSSW